MALDPPRSNYGEHEMITENAKAAAEVRRRLDEHRQGLKLEVARLLAEDPKNQRLQKTAGQIDMMERVEVQTLRRLQPEAVDGIEMPTLVLAELIARERAWAPSITVKVRRWVAAHPGPAIWWAGLLILFSVGMMTQ